MSFKPTKATKATKANKKTSDSLAAGLVPGASEMVLELAKEVQFLPGCGFGITQSVMLGAIDVKLPRGFDFAKIEKALEEFVLSPIDNIAEGDNEEARLVSRINRWQSVIQFESKLPVFGGGRLFDYGEVLPSDGLRRIRFVLPSYSLILSQAAIQFVIKAIVALAPNAANADAVLPGIRARYKELLQMIEPHAAQGSNIHFIEAAHHLGIERHPVLPHIWAFGLGCHRYHFNSSLCSDTSFLGVYIARDKLKCGQLLVASGLPVARKALARNADAAVKLAETIGYPVVIKPVNSDQGRGVTAGIVDEADLRKAYATAFKVSKQVMIEKHHYGRDYRVTVFHGKAVKVLDRRPGGVIGDGASTIAVLVAARRAAELADRAYLRKGRLPLMIDEEAKFQLAAQGLDESSVVPAGQFVPLRRRANISTGGSYVTLSPDEIHPDNRQLGENAAIALGLDIAGVDIISGDPMVSWRETGGIVCEVNAQPQIGNRKGEKLFGEILTTLLGGRGEIPIHLLLLQEGFALPNPLPELAQRAKFNAAVWGNLGWVAEAGTLGPFADVFQAVKGVLLDRRVTGALVAMTEPEVLRFGLPIARFDSIRLIGGPGWEPVPTMQQLIAKHSQKIIRFKPQSIDQ